MRDQLIRYIDLLFAGSPSAYDIKQEILQNTLDRYDDLIAQGKAPAAAYSLSISGIGDISEVLGNTAPQGAAPHPNSPQETSEENKERKRNRAVAIAFYILCPVPLFILSEFGLDTMGLCFTLLMVAAATFLMVLSGKSKPIDTIDPESHNSFGHPGSKTDVHLELRRSVRAMIWAVGLAVYFVMSFVTNAWYITWVVFPLTASIAGLVNACIDLKEANRNEN